MISIRLLVKTTVCLLAFLATQTTFAQFSRTISGAVTLDQGVAEQNYPVTVTVIEGFERFVSDFRGGFRVVFEERDREQTTVVIPAGQRTAAYRVPGVSTFSLSYRVLIECGRCGVMTGTQYYTDSGTQFFANSNATFSNSELPPFIDVVIQTGFSVEGSISLADDALAPRDLSFQVIGETIESNGSREFRSETIKLLQGTSSAIYKIRGLRPDLRGSFRLQLNCANCQDLYPDKVRLNSGFPLGQNIVGANFSLREPNSLAPIIFLLLE